MICSSFISDTSDQNCLFRQEEECVDIFLYFNSRALSVSPLVQVRNSSHIPINTIGNCKHNIFTSPGCFPFHHLYYFIPLLTCFCSLSSVCMSECSCESGSTLCNFTHHSYRESCSNSTENVSAKEQIDCSVLPLLNICLETPGVLVLQ